ncbi:MAG: hypothetical protein U0V72_03820 [Cytophagales bacterium]
MKKISITLLLILGLFSCKKIRNCDCTINTPTYSKTDSYELNQNLRESKRECELINGGYKSSFKSDTTSAECKLK